MIIKNIGGVFVAKCIIFCAGGFDGLIEPIADGDFVIAADGGLAHCSNPNLILGDFDSLGYVPAGAEVFPVEKDDTDAMLAVRKGLALGFTEFVLYGSLDGPRLDHSIANFQTLQFLVDHGATGWLVGLTQMVTVVKNGSLRFPSDFVGTISVFCMGEPAKGVTVKGLKYKLDNGSLTPGFPLGVSNSFVGQPAEIAVKDGSLLVILSRQKAFPTQLTPLASPYGGGGTA